MSPRFIQKANNWSTNLRKKLWVSSNKELENSKTPRLDNFINITSTIAIIIVLVSIVLVSIQYYRGDHPIYSSARSGAVCNDGWQSNATGSGACSHHGGVAYWTHPQIGFHYYNPQPYWIIIASCLCLFLIVSLLSKASRKRLISIFAELFNAVVIIVYFMLTGSIYIIYYLFSHLVTFIKSDRPNKLLYLTSNFFIFLTLLLFYVSIFLFIRSFFFGRSWYLLYWAVPITIVCYIIRNVLSEKLDK